MPGAKKEVSVVEEKNKYKWESKNKLSRRVHILHSNTHDQSWFSKSNNKTE